MELSIEVPDDILNFENEKLDTLCSSSVSCQLTEVHDIIDSSKLDFSDDENWLCNCSNPSNTDLKKWLYSSDDEFGINNLKLASKNIDTRTFTRPKKRFTRPSIEKYNEELYGTEVKEVKELTEGGIQMNWCSQDDATPTKPLHFDLDQPTSSVYFENILANAPMLDSFTNMSPPSLVNSMCSSTFANLMENSFIKNDPVLREIRDTDFTGSILQQEDEPMFQSITESYSSLNSDVPENFLKKVSFSEKTEETLENLNDTVARNATFAKEETAAHQTVVFNKDDFHDAKSVSYENLNSTYQLKTSTKHTSPLNTTYQRRKSNEPRNLNSTVTIEPEKNTSRGDKAIENVKRLLDRRPSPSLDLNRLSYLVDKNDRMNSTLTNENPKRNSFGSTDSGENLDYMSLSSSSDKSSKRQSTDGINVLVDLQEHKFQIMSTPNARAKRPTFSPYHEISPIADRNSDPEMSSNEPSVKCMIPQNPIRKQKSVGNIHQKLPNPKSINTLSQMDKKQTIRGSHPNLRMPETRTIQRPSTNLNSMGHTLKGSYTSLKPMNPNLPVAPPPLDTTMTLTKNPVVVAQVAPVMRQMPKSLDAQFVKPQPVRSGLPRPVTGIPRPASRIPGPSNVRPVSKSAGYQGRY